MLKTPAYAVLATLLPLALAAEEPAHPLNHNIAHNIAEPAGSCSDGFGMAMAMPSSRDPVVAAWQRINLDMHAGMSIDFTGDPDTDFMKGMIPHHQGAINMANALLQHGKDAEIRALANAIIRAQEEEIAMMQSWLAAREDR